MPDPIQNAEGVYQVPPITVTPQNTPATVKFADLSTDEQHALLKQTSEQTTQNIVGYSDLTPEERLAIGEQMQQQKVQEAETRKQQFGPSAEAQLGASLKTFQMGQIHNVAQPGEKSIGTGFQQTDDPWLRFDNAFSNTVEQSVNTIKDHHPELDVRTFTSPTGGKVIALRKPGDDGFTLLNSAQAYTLSDMAALGGNLLRPENIATAAAAFATQGASYWTRVGATMAGGAVGSGMNTMIENSRHAGGVTLGQGFELATTSGALNGIVDGIFNPIVKRGANLATGRAPFTLTPEERQGIGILSQEGGSQMNMADVVPALGAVKRQVSPLSKQLQMKTQNFLAGELGKLQSLADLTTQSAGQWDDKTILQAHKQAIGELFNIAGFAHPSLDTAGDSIQEGLKQFRRAEKANLEVLYNNADKEGASATFDVTQAQNTARDALKGILAKTEEGGAINVVGPMPSDLKSAMDDLAKLQPQVSAFGDHSAVQQIRALRNRFYDLKYADTPGNEDRWNHLAGEVYDDLTSAMQNPSSASPQYMAALKTANDAYKEYDTAVNMANIKRAAVAGDPGKIMDMVAQPGNGGTVGTLARILPPDKWKAFTDGFQADIASRSSSEITGALDKWNRDPDTLNLLMSPQDQIEMRVYAQTKAKLEQGYNGALNQAVVGLRAAKFVDSLPPEELKTQVARLGGADSIEGKKLAAGVLTAIAQDASELDKGRWVLNPDKLVSAVNKLDQSGKLDIVFDAQIAQKLRDRRLIASLSQGVTTDAGASIAAAEVAGHVKNLAGLVFQPVKGIKSVARGAEGLYQAWAWAHVFNSNTLNSIVLGTGKKPLDFTTLRALSLVTAQLANEAGQDNQK